MSEGLFRQLFPDQTLQRSSLELRTYTGEVMPVVGEATVDALYADQPSKTLPLVVVNGQGPSLLGRNWLQHFVLEWQKIKLVRQDNDALRQLLAEYEEVFSDELGTLAPMKAKLSVSPSATPRFHRPRPVPYALKPLVEQELDRLERTGVLEQVNHSDWAAPIVTVPKRDGQVPDQWRGRLLAELHRDHPGACKMKSVARSYMWWPGMDSEIENLAKSCSDCHAVKKAPPTAPLHPWEWPSRVFQRVHVDFAGPFQGAMFLVAVDAYSKWPHVVMMQTTTVSKTIDVLRQMFSMYGVPEHVVSDNGPQFTAEEFAVFLERNGVRHTRSAPYHPATNGLAERFVQSLKQGLRAS